MAILPNHVHLVIRLLARSNRPTGQDPGRLGGIIGKLKEFSAKQINDALGHSGARVWHRDFHDRILRSPDAVQAAIDYVRNNVRKHGSSPQPRTGAPAARPGR